ncbi:sensor histidine kinase [Leptobacterium flavescens]|uniref:Sensor histidine kinase n=1 Tax=Leptobacterium flavescens TaxID=472055 RepID=A0A6P0UJT6_9FLAO|nr:histidine kinase [Leptobacterium flavescens]NER13631.1 sensor histidine kinase [Leptobacterium flavescens]
MKAFLRSYWSPILMLLLLAFTMMVGNTADFRVNISLLILVVFGFVFLIQWLFQKKKIAQLQAINTQAELSLLKSQVDPHFYFNTLNNLYALSNRKSEKAPEMILKLSEIMRYVIYKGNEKEVSLKEEIKYLENYIELQKLRFQDKVEINFSKNGVSDHLQIAPLLLIIPLENAFKHGVDSIVKDAYININLTTVKQQLFVEVINNFEEEDKTETTGGIGLKNLKRRLQLLYGNDYEMVINKEKNEYKFQLLIHLK